MSSWQVGLVVLGVAGAIALVVLSARGMKASFEQGREIDATLIERYVREVVEGRYDAAWSECLSAAYRSGTPMDAFAAAHERRRSEVGVLGRRELFDVQSTRTLFDPARTWYLRYRLFYPGGERIGVIVVNNTDGTPRIEGTHVESPGETLTFEIW